MLAQYLSYEFIALFMFITMLAMMFTGQRVFGAIGFVAVISALLVWGNGAIEMPYTATWKLFKWYPMLTLPLFIYMGFMISESGIASDLYKMFHVFFWWNKRRFSNWHNVYDGWNLSYEWIKCCRYGYRGNYCST